MSISQLFNWKEKLSDVWCDAIVALLINSTTFYLVRLPSVAIIAIAIVFFAITSIERSLVNKMTMTMDEDENTGPANGSLQPQSMICSSTDFNSTPTETSTTTNNESVSSSACLVGDIRLGFSQVKGTLEDDVADGGLHFTFSRAPF